MKAIAICLAKTIVVTTVAADDQKAREHVVLDRCALGLLYSVGPQQDEAKAAVWYGRAAEQADPTAEYILGMLYDEGRGVPEDPSKAVLWLRRAAEQGLARAQFRLGVLSAEGRGVPRDTEAAIEWYRRAAAQGHEEAQDRLHTTNSGGVRLVP